MFVLLIFTDTKIKIYVTARRLLQNKTLQHFQNKIQCNASENPLKLSIIKG